MTEPHELEMVYACDDDEEAAIVIGFLNSQGIEANIDSDLPHDTFPVEGDSKIYVNQNDAETARALLAERDAAGAPPLVDENTVVEEDQDDGEEA